MGFLPVFFSASLTIAEGQSIRQISKLGETALTKFTRNISGYSTPFLFLKFLPFFSNRMLMTEGVRFNYLYTPTIKNFMELGYFFNLGVEAGVFVGFENFRYRSFGVAVSVSLNQMMSF